VPEAGLRGLLRGVSRRKGANAPSFRGAYIPGVVFLKYGGGIFENIPEKCGIFVICRRAKLDERSSIGGFEGVRKKYV